mmetsp:Transcript_18080/g.39407  ORF Transcript_18080/g.39407 Transcript_18080/m.39407 type:complete len:264 (-) Transcript_18080:306-1097(-)|eukprot:CAMPEP_0168170034 /NCGR_PEP_ID=MMETSP0139_2-20121125/3954_1 /TAXON_ID=44445 /ORGANISM="Pseudo-nitzschia australis, Strain 10249 10 AB" /LENGTH=263 /DNA_ID=CAMNT_0008087489 /DNA_START=134 /DNA_END=925 /DNA_ORIENTATION=+
MKFTILLLSMCAGTTSAFVPASSSFKPSSVSSTSLNVASIPPPKNNLDGWSTKPLHVHETTTPVVDPKFSRLNRMRMKDTVLPPSFALTWAVGLLGPLIMMYHPSYMADGSPSLIGIFGGGFHILFATLLWVQTSRVRCVFEKDSFEFYNVKGPRLDYENGKAELVRKPDNYVSGTPNRWKYDTIINYGFFPSEDFPVICYFKETETPEYKWNRWFAAFDSYGNGQPHFFPGICNVKMFKDQMELRGAARKPIPTLKSSREKN